MSELTIREMENGEEFADWFADLTQREEESTGEPVYLDEHFLILSNEIGDWVGGLRYYQRGGVAHVLDIAVRPEARHLGYAHRMLEAFERRAAEDGAHLAEFWTDDLSGEGELLAYGWDRVLRRENYIAGRTWHLMEKRLEPAL